MKMSEINRALGKSSEGYYYCLIRVYAVMMYSHILKKQIKAQMRRKSKQIQDELVCVSVFFVTCPYVLVCRSWT